MSFSRILLAACSSLILVTAAWGAPPAPISSATVVPSDTGSTTTLAAAIGGRLLKANNLSDVLNAATARTNLGLGSIATQSAGAVAIIGGTVSGSTLTQAPSAAGASPVYAPDGSTQAVIGWVPAYSGPSEVPTLLPGVFGAGSSLLCTSATASANVDCNVVMQGTGSLTVGNSSGVLSKFLDPADVVSGYFTFLPATISAFRTNTLRMIPVPQQGVTSLHVEIDTVLGGFAAGINNQARGVGNAVFGLNSQGFGTGSLVSGSQSYDWNGFGVRCHQSSAVASVTGSNLLCEQTLQRSTTGGVAFRLTADGGSGVTNTVSVPFQSNGHGTWEAEVECAATSSGGTTTAGDTAVWLAKGSFSKVPATLTFPYTTGTGASLVGSGTLSTATLAVTADVTNINMNVSVTPPAGNTGTIACEAAVRWMQRIS